MSLLAKIESDLRKITIMFINTNSKPSNRDTATNFSFGSNFLSSVLNDDEPTAPR